MSQYLSNTQGSHGWVSRTGTKKSGMYTHVGCATLGVAIDVRHDEETGKDVFDVYKTHGTQSQSSGRELIVTLESED